MARLIPDEELDKLLNVEDQLEKAGMGKLRDDDLIRLFSPTTRGPQRLPIAGFQGTPVAPNPAGGFVDQSGLAPLALGLGGPSQVPPSLGSTGQPVQNFQIPRRPDLNLLAQGQPQASGGAGMDFNIRLGPDRQIQQLLIRRLRNQARLV